MGSIFSLGIAAAYGANYSTKTIPEKRTYSTEKKTINHTFKHEGTAFAITNSGVTGNGELISFSPKLSDKTVTFEMVTYGLPLP